MKEIAKEGFILFLPIGIAFFIFKFVFDTLDGIPQPIIEAIFENLEAKQALYESVEPRMKPGALLATNTSSIRLEDLRTVLKAPERFIGLHFFNPVAQLPLVEVIRCADTDGATRLGAR